MKTHYTVSNIVVDFVDDTLDNLYDFLDNYYTGPEDTKIGSLMGDITTARMMIKHIKSEEE